jgi:ABC transporter
MRSTWKAKLYYVVLWVIALVYFFPVLWIILSAFKTKNDLLATPPKWLFPPTLANFSNLFARETFSPTLVNSLLISFLSVSIAIVVSFLAAYALSRFKPVGSDFIMFLILSIRMVPAPAVVVPVYLMYAALGWKDSFWAMKIDGLLDKYPNQLSGGEKQRVALARGIVKDSDIFILDDPLVGLDFKLREQLFVDLRLMLSEIDGTFIYTTSDPLETLALADDVFVLDQGEIVDQGSVDQVYEEPSSLRAFQLLGFPGANTMSGSLAHGICGLPLETLALNWLTWPIRRSGEK